MTARGRFSTAALTALLCSAAALAGQQSRDAAPAPAGTASIAGTVFVAGESRQPARRVRVTLTDLGRTFAGATTTTDDRGAFAFRGLPAGRFEIQAVKPAYLRSSYGASRPERAGTPVVVNEGQAVTGLTMSIVRGGVIGGTVRDARQRPLPGVTVRVLKLGYNAITGERTLGAPSSGASNLTDDRGEYRAYGLPPGDYLVLVVPPSDSGPGGVSDLRVVTAAEVKRVLEMAKSSAPGTISAPATPSAAATPSPAPRARLTYAPVFHPGATDIGAAGAVSLKASEERNGVDITTQLVPTATIRGIVTDPTGTLPPMLSVSVVPAGAHVEMLAGAGVRGMSGTPRPDGSYSLSGIAPGAYTVIAQLGRGRGAGPDAPVKWASADVVVNGRDLDVPLTLQPGVRIEGRVVFEGAQPTPAELQTLAFLLVPPGSGGQLLSAGGGRVDAEGRFSFAGVVPAAYQFVTNWSSPGASSRWAIKSSVANGREAFEAPLRVNPGEPLTWTVTFTDTPTTLAGVFQDRTGRAAPDYYMLVFPTERGLWMPGSRRIRTTRPATDGAFTFRGLPPGEYFLSALTDLAPGEWNDAALLEQLVPSSAKVTLRDGQTTSQDFRIGG